MFAQLNPHSSDFGDICAPNPPFLHQLIMQSSLFEPGRPVIFTRSTGERVDATMKGPPETGDQFAVLEYMKAGLLVTHPCAPLQKIEFFIRSPSPSPEQTSPPPPSPVAEVCAEPEVVAKHSLVFACLWEQGWRLRCTHTLRSLMCVSVVVCVACKLRPCPSYSRRTDCINLVLWRSLYKGGEGKGLALWSAV